MIINNISIAYAENGIRPQAIHLWQELDEFLEERFMNCRERMYLRAPILLNLIKYLGLEGRYPEEIELADKAIRQLTQIMDELLQSCYGHISHRQYESAQFIIDYIKKSAPQFAQDVRVLHCEEVLCRQIELDYRTLDL